MDCPCPELVPSAEKILLWMKFGHLATKLEFLASFFDVVWRIGNEGRICISFWTFIRALSVAHVPPNDEPMSRTRRIPFVDYHAVPMSFLVIRTLDVEPVN